MKNFLQWLNEMPLANFHVDTSPKELELGGGYAINKFSATDTKVLNHPKTAITLEKVLLRSTKIPFNIFIVQDTGRRGNNNSLFGKDRFKDEIQKLCTQKNVSLAGHITFGKNGGTGDPSTPWMLLHNIGHAFTDEDNSLFDKFYKLRDKYFPNKTFYDFLPHLKFASARKNKAENREEIVHELFAEYLWHGFIRSTTEIKPMIDEMTKLIQETLQKFIGHIIVDYA